MRREVIVDGRTLRQKRADAAEQRDYRALVGIILWTILIGMVTAACF